MGTNIRIDSSEFYAEEDWRDILVQTCPMWATLARVECEAWYAVFEIVDPRYYESWIEIPELE